MYKNAGNLEREREREREKRCLWNPFDIFLTFTTLVICCDVSFGAVRVKTAHVEIAQSDNSNTVDDMENMSEIEIIKTLRSDIQTLDADIAKCEKQSKGWIAATVIGGAGIVGTGAAAIAQAGKVSDKKSELSGLQTEYKTLNTQVNSAEETLKSLQ